MPSPDSVASMDFGGAHTVALWQPRGSRSDEKVTVQMRLDLEM